MLLLNLQVTLDSMPLLIICIWHTVDFFKHKCFFARIPLDHILINLFHLEAPMQL